MRLQPRLKVVLVLVAALVLSVRCAPPPPNLTPQATVAFQNTEALKTLDLIRDLAQDGAHSGLWSRTEALAVTNWHTAAIHILDARTANWQTQIISGLDAVVTQLSPSTRNTLMPYLTLLRTVLGAPPR